MFGVEVEAGYLEIDQDGRKRETLRALDLRKCSVGYLGFMHVLGKAAQRADWS